MRRFPGVVTGIVRSLDDPQGQGRIQLVFPWMSEQENSAWAPVAAPLAGGDRGMFFQPEIDDEVLVAFEHGDFDHPFILGYLWNGVDTPPETTNKNRVIVTPGGHTVRFEDTDGAKKIIIQSDGGHKIVLDDAAHTITVGDQTGSNQIQIQTAAGTITIQATTQVTVAAPLISLTGGAAHPLVFGDALLGYLNTLVAQLQSHVHPGQMALGVFPVTPAPPTPALPFLVPNPLMNSTQVKTG